MKNPQEAGPRKKGVEETCVFVTMRLIQGRRWAWWTAFAVSTTMLGLGAFLL